MGQAVRNPDRALVDRIRQLELDVSTLKRLPTGQGTIGVNILAKLPAVRATGGSKSIANNSGFIVYNSLSAASSFNNGPMFSGGAPDRVTAVVAGIYVVNVAWQWAGSAAGERQVFVLLNGGGYGLPDASSPTAAGNHAGTLTQLIAANAADYFGVAFFQNSGGALNVSSVEVQAALLTTA